ncbi:hypothetical protein BHE74_00048064, partial [Ensete ventricosum]
VADICGVESEHSSNGGGGRGQQLRRLRLRYDLWVQVKVVATMVQLRQWEKGQQSAQLLQKRVAVVWSERLLLIVFNLLLVAIKAIGSERSLLVPLCSERSLLVALCNERSLLVMNKSLLVATKVDDSIVQQEVRSAVEGVKGDLVAKRLVDRWLKVAIFWACFVSSFACDLVEF